MANQNTPSAAWVAIPKAAEILKVRPRLVYLWLEKPQEETKIRRRRNDARTLEVHLASVKAYADERPGPGRPRKQ